MKYFPNNSGFDCFKSSLCNLLIQENEQKLAKQVYYEFSNSDLTQNSEKLGINLAITPRLVRDLTNNKYDALLQTAGFNYDVFNQPFEVYPKRLARKMSRIIKNEFNNGNIVITPNSQIYNPDYIISVNSPNLNINHFMVQRTDGKLINDGVVQKPKPNQQINGVLQIFR